MKIGRWSPALPDRKVRRVPKTDRFCFRTNPRVVVLLAPFRRALFRQQHSDP
jgi:hypothetical protein